MFWRRKASKIICWLECLVKINFFDTNIWHVSLRSENHTLKVSENKFQLDMYNSLGELVKSNFGNGKSFSLSVKDLSEGLYFGKIYLNDNKQFLFRFMVVR